MTHQYNMTVHKKSRQSNKETPYWGLCWNDYGSKFIFLVNKRLQNRQLYVLQYIFKNSLSYISTFVFWFFGGIFLFCFVFCSVLVWLTMKRSNFMKMCHVIATCMVSRWHLITTHMILNIETADNELINIVLANEWSSLNRILFTTILKMK